MGISSHRVAYSRYGLRSKIFQTDNKIIIILVIVKVITIIPCYYYTEATERNAMNCGEVDAGGFTLCIPLAPLVYANQHKALVASEANEALTVPPIV
jgi:hypothetical protein